MELKSHEAIIQLNFLFFLRVNFTGAKCRGFPVKFISFQKITLISSINILRVHDFQKEII